MESTRTGKQHSLKRCRPPAIATLGPKRVKKESTRNSVPRSRTPVTPLGRSLVTQITKPRAISPLESLISSNFSNDPSKSRLYPVLCSVKPSTELYYPMDNRTLINLIHQATKSLPKEHLQVIQDACSLLSNTSHLYVEKNVNIRDLFKDRNMHIFKANVEHHCIYLKVKKNEDQTFNVTIYNRGAGIQKIYPVIRTDSNKIQSAISFLSLSEKDMQQIVNQSCTKKKPDQFYDLFRPFIRQVDKIGLKAKQSKQKIGDCAIKTTTAFLANEFIEKLGPDDGYNLYKTVRTLITKEILKDSTLNDMTRSAAIVKLWAQEKRYFQRHVEVDNTFTQLLGNKKLDTDVKRKITDLRKRFVCTLT